jgi:hypothetical protein
VLVHAYTVKYIEGLHVRQSNGKSVPSRGLTVDHLIHKTRVNGIVY